ncbi:MAG TPA: mycofactocin precursor MftA [Streptosporangiaceae bacterium]|nr:mycofactocin precursor MftA [Streptosporangiaceae bacterium]
MGSTNVAGSATLVAERDVQAAATAEPVAIVETDVVVTEELLVEEVSIDGMCGVY